MVYGIYTKILLLQKKAIQADTDAAKAMDGVNEGVTKDGLQNK